MKVLTLFLPLFLWIETTRASVIKQDELPFMELRIDSDDDPLRPSDVQDKAAQQDSTNISKNAGKPLSEFEFFNAKLLNISSPNKTSYKGSDDPTLKAGLFEGDIAGIDLSKNQSLGKNAIIDANKRWPGGNIPYVIANTFDSAARLLIAKAMAEYHLRTCIRFMPRTNENDYVFIYQGIGCSSCVGRVGGVQLLSLGNNCVHFGVIVHELMHAVGFWHEQSRGDRDTYVNIIWNNIPTALHYNFQKYNWNQIQHLNEAYDFRSIMHYEPYAFALNKAYPTIVSKVSGATFGQKNYFSYTDIRKINALYKCGDQIFGSMVAASSHCQDAHENCVAFARRGECGKNPTWMRPHCMNACGLCRTGIHCVDIIGECPQWGVRGECEKNPAYMKTQCKKSCRICSY